MRMLLAHSSGCLLTRSSRVCQTRDDLVRAALTARLLKTPGTHVDYSDIGFIILGEALAARLAWRSMSSHSGNFSRRLA